MKILNVKQGGNFVEYMVDGMDDAKHLVAQLLVAGFPAELMDQARGLSATELQKVIVHNKKGGFSRDTIEYVKSLDNIEFVSGGK